MKLSNNESWADEFFEALRDNCAYNNVLIEKQITEGNKMNELNIAIHELQVYIIELQAAGDFEQAAELQNFLNNIEG